MDESELRRQLGLPPLPVRKFDNDADWEGVEKEDIGTVTVRPLADASCSIAGHQKQSRLLSLPAEIRQRIYELVLCFPGRTVDLRWVSSKYAASSGQNSVLAILGTCRQVLEEAEDIFYSMNSLRYPVGASVPRYWGSYFLTSLGITRKNAIRHMVFYASSASQALETMTALQSIPNMETLRMERTQSIRYIDVRSWNLLKEQLKTALGGCKSLRKLEIVTPRADMLAPWEEERVRNVDEIDTLLREFVLRKPYSGSRALPT